MSPRARIHVTAPFFNYLRNVYIRSKALSLSLSLSLSRSRIERRIETNRGEEAREIQMRRASRVHGKRLNVEACGCALPGLFFLFNPRVRRSEGFLARFAIKRNYPRPSRLGYSR